MSGDNALFYEFVADGLHVRFGDAEQAVQNLSQPLQQPFTIRTRMSAAFGDLSPKGVFNAYTLSNKNRQRWRFLRPLSRDEVTLLYAWILRQDEFHPSRCKKQHSQVFAAAVRTAVRTAPDQQVAIDAMMVYLGAPPLRSVATNLPDGGRGLGLPVVPSHDDGLVDLHLIENYEDALDSARTFWDCLRTPGDEVYDRLEDFQHWYYFPEISQLAPSKYIGYKRMTPNVYRGHSQHGSETEDALAPHFVRLPMEWKFAKARYEELCRQLKRKTLETRPHPSVKNGPGGIHVGLAHFYRMTGQ